MRRLKLEAGKRALAIVAHPDDETIWLGGTILMNPKVRWTIFCLTRKSDRDRCPKFKRVCRRYQAKAIITDIDDTGQYSFKNSVASIKRILSLKLKNKSFAYCFCHGKNGEYGHKLHRAVYRAVSEWNPHKKLKSKYFFTFNYKKSGKNTVSSMTIAPDSDYFVKLSPKIFKEKKTIQSEMHGYPWNGVDNRLCTRVEGFKWVTNYK
jgi:LmbE family N-acetylglucosaminyl deacetylase